MRSQNIMIKNSTSHYSEIFNNLFLEFLRIIHISFSFLQHWGEELKNITQTSIINPQNRFYMAMVRLV